MRPAGEVILRVFDFIFALFIIFEKEERVFSRFLSP